MAYEWEDPRRKWLQDMSPSVLERVSQQPAGKRRTWLARGDIKAAHQSRRQKLLDQANMQQQQQISANRQMQKARQQMMMSRMPLEERKFQAQREDTQRSDMLRLQMQQNQFNQQQVMQEGSQEFTAGQGDLGFRRDLMKGDIGHGRDIGETDLAFNRSRGRAMEDRQWRLEDRPPPDPVMMRGEGGDMYWQGVGQPIQPGATRPGIYEEPQIPSVAEQEAKILSQFELGSPEWIQTRMQIEEIKRAPIEPVQQMLALQRLFRGTRETGPMGQLMQETMPGQEGVLDYARQGLNAMTGKVLNEQEVAALLQEANGDVNLARQIAEQRGWVIPQ